MADYGIGQKPLTCLGIDLTRPGDRSLPGKWPIIENVVETIDGVPTVRAGLGATAHATGPTGKTPAHSVRTLNDPTVAAGTWCRVFGIADRLCDERSATSGTINDLLGGFSGNPLSLVPARPTGSPQPWMYIADSLLMRKLASTGGTLHQIGLPPPTGVPEAIVDSAFFRTVDLFEATTGWTAGGTAGAPSLLSAGPGRPVDTVLLSASPKSSTQEFNASTGSLACIAPASMTNIVVGMVLECVLAGPSNESVLVTEVHSGSTSTAITQILYDSGTTGLCSITLAASPREIEVNSLVLITGVATAGSEYARVREVIPGSGGAICVRLSTASNRAATDTVEAKPSFTCHPFNSIPTAATFKADGIRSNITATTAGNPATLSKVATLDLSSVLYSASTSGSSLFDYLSIIFRSDKPDLITEIRLMLDCDPASVSAGAFTATAFTQNYFFGVITASDIANLLKFNQTALANRQDQITRARIDAIGKGEIPLPIPIEQEGPGDAPPPGPFDQPGGLIITTEPSPDPTPPSRDQLGPGENQFFQARFRLSEMQRVGNDSRGWKDIVGVRIAVLCSGTVNLDVDSWVLFGGYEPEVDDISEGYRYAYRGRVSSTGVVSNFSPASQGAVRPVRQSVYLTFTQHPSTECDKLDIFRRGGSVVVPGWRWIATIANGASPTLTDTVSNFAALSVPEENGFDHYQPWPLTQKPVSGTATTVAGTLVKLAAASADTDWAPGSPFIANNVHTSIRRVLSTTLVEINHNCGAGSSVAWEAPASVVAGQPLPVLIEWPEEGRLVGLGDPNAPGAFYLTRKAIDGVADPDSTLESLRFEIPGAVLQNGLAWGGGLYLWSTDKQYRVDPAGVDPLGHLLLRITEVPGSRGLAARWALCGGDAIHWLAKDGICRSPVGGAPSLITDDDLYPLFPHAGLPGVAVSGFNPPLITTAQEPNLRLSWGDGRLMFCYVDSGSARRVLEWRRRGGPETSGWYPHVFTPGIAYLYYEEGPGKHQWLALGADTPTAKVYVPAEATSDAGTAITATAQTQSENVGDPRKRKRWGDLTTEIDTDGASIAVVIGFDNHTATLTPSTSPVTGSAGTRQITVHDITDGTTVGGGREATNISLKFTTTVTTERPKLYMWEPTWLNRPEVTARRGTDFLDGGYSGTKMAQGIRLLVDTKGASRSLVVQTDGDGTVNVATVTGILSAGHGPVWVTKSFVAPFVYRTARVIPTDAGNWQLFDWEIVGEPEPDMVTYYETQQTTHDIDEVWKCVRDALLTLRSTATVTFSILDADDRSVLYSVEVASTGGFRKPNYLPLASKKFKAAIYTLSSAAAFAVYVRDSWVRVRGWGRYPEWQRAKPFGDIHRAKGAVV